MKQIAVLAATLMVLPAPQARKAKKPAKPPVTPPAVQQQVVSVETENTSLILLIDGKGQVYTRHYGARIGQPGLYLEEALGEEDYNTCDGLAYPATGGRFVGEPALQVKYADGTHNTELYFTGVSSEERGGCSVTTLSLKDYVTELSVKLVFEAYLQEDIIVEHTEILNGGKQPLELLNYASSSLYVQADDYLLTHFWGAWAADMQMEHELLGHDLKVIESRRGTQATQGNNPSFLLSLGTRLSR